MKHKSHLPARWYQVFCVPLIIVFFNFRALGQQSLQVHGTVTSASGTALIGVTVLVKGTSKGTTSDTHGKYTIDASRGDTLVFRYVGYAEQHLAVSRPVMDVVMQLSSSKLNDVVVIGYGTQKEATVTGAISTVGGKALLRTPSVTTSSALVGKVQGITARAPDARPGNGTKIQIRSLGDPLYVIDGVPYGGKTGVDGFGFTSGSGQDIFNNLDMNDIESITILKDASAAIYGLRASNGVVLITTKKGAKNEKPQINVSGYYGIQNFTRYPKPANAYEYIRASVESDENLGLPPGYTPEELQKWKEGKQKGYKSYNYFDQVMTANVPQYNVHASASGGTKRSKYYLGIGNIKQAGVIKDFNFSRSNIQANISTDLAQGLQVGAQVSANFQKRHNVGVPGLDDYFNPFLSILSMWPTESPYANDNPKYINQTHNVNVNPATYKDDVTGWINDLRREVNVNLNAEYDFPFGLKIKGVYSRNYQNEDFDGFEYTWKAYKYDSTNDTYYTEPGYGNQNPWREKHKRNVKSRYAQLRLNYEKQWEDHFLSAMIGYERSDYENTYIAIHGVPTNNYIQQMSFSNLDYLGDDWNIEAREGYIGRLNYNYKEKYLLEFLGRYDGSYLYAPSKRWGFFPGVSAGWRISDEPFFRNSLGDVVNNLKLRLSWGETGSEIGVDPFGYLSGYDYNEGGAVLDGAYIIGMRSRGMPITNLSWVTNQTKNVGIDFGLFDSKITGQFDAFERKRSGLPAARYDVLLPSEVGDSLPYENLNSDATFGLEGIVTYNGHSGQFNYSIGANATLARWKILHTYKPRFGNSWDKYRNSEEERWDFIDWGYQITGRFRSREQIDNYEVDNDGQGNRTELPGDFIYKDVNGDKVINEMDERPIGYQEGGQPYMSYGINGSISWKGIELSFDFVGATMQSFLRDWELRYPFQNNGNSPAYMFTDRWHHEDVFDASSPWIPGTYPAIRKNNTAHVNYKKNDFWLTNVHYLRLKNLEIGYVVPQAFLKKIGVNYLKVYINGTNIFSIDNVRDFQIDPEISSTNGLVYPSQRLFNIGFNLSL